MILAEKKKLYLSRFPLVLAQRMCAQMDSFHIIRATNSNGHLALFFCKNISHTAEGGRFWTEIAELYMNRHDPSPQEIHDVFVNNSILYQID